MDIHGWSTEDIDGGVALTTEPARRPGGRALHDPRPGEPRTPGPGASCRFHWAVTTLLVAVTLGLVAWLMGSRGPAARGRSADGPRMDVPDGQRLAWFSRASNPWLHGFTGLER